jgi:methylated-DNA-[protein]-cysteine S-methyltransferase
MEEPGIYARESPYLGCVVEFGYASGKVLSVSFPEAAAEDASPDHPLLDRTFAYLEGGQEAFDDVEVALTVPTDRRSVLEAAREIPYGEDVTVVQLARMTPGLDADDEDDRRLVREALADNPAPLLVPDHRIRDAPSAAPSGVELKFRQLEDL